ncbi:hypothetical protein PYW08_001734 [Mythimna loreyi]|uniref:Uncharacterized protein n=1 Tax=Mythimna loreyi TaxID=667449 RepID=A0ACC2RA77_9NEOP|nr:hypothetical protein PYW08_016950 [Mythimna loreyi]KAJ8733436.1 hypothetical protein PYW08_001734 [Mythimna loreyi]
MGNLDSKKAHKNSTMKQIAKITTQVGPGQAGESHADSSVSPHRILGGGNSLPFVAASSRSAADLAPPFCTDQAAVLAPSTNTDQAAVLAPSTSTDQAADLAPLIDTDQAASNAPIPTLSAPPTSAWQQSLVRNSVTQNPDNDTDKARLTSLGKALRALTRQLAKTEAKLKKADPEPGSGMADGSGGCTPIPADEVRVLLSKREKLRNRERELSDRMRKIREGPGQRDVQAGSSKGVRDQPEVREGFAQREKGPDAETRERRQVREGVTRREKPSQATVPTEAVNQTQDQTDKILMRKRGKRSGSNRLIRVSAERTLPNASKPQPGPSGSGTAKRDRPDDSASPSALQGDPKRVRTQAAQSEQKTYARATKDIPARLAVAICLPPPSRDLTSDEATHVKSELERLLIESVVSDPTKPLPAFRGYPRVKDGTVQMWCEDENALTWLTQKLPSLRLPNSDQTLTVMRQSDVPTRVRAALFVPRFNGDIALLQSLLINQNAWYDIGRWSLYRATKVGGDNYGTYLTLGIPTDEVDKVLGRERRISYLLGSIYVRFYPQTHPKTESDDTEPTAQTQTETNDPDNDMDKLEEEMARAVMADADADKAPPSPGWTAQLLASSPTDEWRRMEEEVMVSDGSVSS